MRTKNIAKICFQAAFWPALILALLSCILSGIFFKQHMQEIYEREVNQHELIYQLLSKAIIGDIIIQNKHAKYVILNEFKNKYALEDVKIVKIKPQALPFSVIKLISSRSVLSSWALVGVSPNQYAVIESNIKPRDIMIPLCLSLGIILMFIIASLVMYQRIKKQLHFCIVEPLQYTLQSNDPSKQSHFNTNSAATEITDLYHKTQSFLKALHEQRDMIEKNKIEEAKYQMALQVAHDIRSPALTLETISVISDLNTDSKSLIQKVIKRIIEIADNILETHTPHTGTTAADNPTLGSTIDSLIQEKQAYCPNNIRITASISPNCYQIAPTIPAALLSRALSNLINNAIEAIGENAGSIEITASSDNQSVTITVADNGCGIPEEHLPHIFDQNFSLNKKGGKGLGLAFVKRVVEEYGGSVSLEKETERQTLFRLIIPSDKI